MTIEFWVMKVLLHPGPQRRPMSFANIGAREYLRAMACVERGSLTCLPDGCIAEPLQVYSHQLEADEHRETIAKADPEGDYRVILNSSVTV